MKDTGARLTRDTVLRAALELLDEVGIDGLSTRRLAERLGVQSPTLYWHFRNKGELLDAMAEAIMLERHDASPPRPGEAWDAWLAGNARSFRHALLAYRDGARLHAGTRPRALHFSSIERKVALLGDAGFTPDEAVDVMYAIGRFVVGWVLEEQATPRRRCRTRPSIRCSQRAGTRCASAAATKRSSAASRGSSTAPVRAWRRVGRADAFSYPACCRRVRVRARRARGPSNPARCNRRRSAPASHAAT